MLKEIGGYLELEKYSLPMLHEGALALNSGRGCIAYLLEQKGINKLALPRFNCDVVRDTCLEKGAALRCYSVDSRFMPEEVELEADEWMYIVNFYGQLSREVLEAFAAKYPRLIIDNAQAYFAPPVKGADTLYTCRKFFGVPDGAFLYTDAPEKDLPQDKSHDRMDFVLGRFEFSSSEFYARSAENNELFSHIPVMRMSKLTENLLHAIDYEQVKAVRYENCRLLHRELAAFNMLEVQPAEGAFAYPLMLKNGAEIRKKLIEKRIFVPTLWPNVLSEQPENSLEYQFAENILPLPCDQRYGAEEMLYIAEEIKKCIS